MSSRRAMSMPPAAFERQPKKRNRCTSFLCMSWKLFTCIFSHVMLVTLVVAYCIFGAKTFEYLEATNEITVKTGIAFLRGNLTEELWEMTYVKMLVLEEDNWTAITVTKLENFERDILNSMKVHGWDGNEDLSKMQWTFFGALFYSIIVITTIGYGHIAPKTWEGKISTIFYAIIGIPLMLLCLSNIGDIMASSFRFIYWRVCCFVCTREPKHRRPRKPIEFQRPLPMGRYVPRGHQASMRRSIRISQRTADSGVDTYYDPSMHHAHSDTELRYTAPERPNWDQPRSNNTSTNSRNRFRNRNRDRYQSSRHTVERDHHVDRGQRFTNEVIPRSRPGSYRFSRAQSMVVRDKDRTERETQSMKRMPHEAARYHDNAMTLPASYGRNKFRKDLRAQSLDPRGRRDFDPGDLGAPVLCNKYAIDDLKRESESRDPHPQQGQQKYSRAKSMPRQQHQRRGSDLGVYQPPAIVESRAQTLQPPDRNNHYEQKNFLTPPIDDEFFEMQQPVGRKHHKRKEKERHPPSPRIMSPMGFAVHRQARLQHDEESIYGYGGSDEWGDYYSDNPLRPVPIWLCVFLVISYIIAGAFLFSSWEGWDFLDSAYFCFITLTTIGFGDFVPAQGVREHPEKSIAFCSLYLLFGIALLAMSFNLVQEEVISNVKNVARQLGILKEERTEY